jgi:hypothetical protein
MKRLSIVGTCVAFLLVMSQLAIAQQWPSGNWETTVVVTSDKVHEEEASVEQKGSTFVIKAGGDDIWGSADQFTYVYKTVTGDFHVMATLHSLENTHDYAKAGIMARQDLSPGSVNVLTYSRGADDLAMLQRREVADSDSASRRMTSTGAERPVTIRLIRTGNEFMGGWSKDGGKTWEKNVHTDGTPTPPAVVEMSDPILLGVAVTSHAAGVITTAEVEVLGDPNAAVRQARKLSVTWGILKASH